MNTILNRSVVLVATVAATALSLAAAAPLNAAPVSIDVGYSDVDLSSDTGVSTIKQRIRHAANRVCDNGATPLVAASCRNKAVASAEMKLALVQAEVVQTTSVQFAAR